MPGNKSSRSGAELLHHMALIRFCLSLMLALFLASAGTTQGQDSEAQKLLVEAAALRAQWTEAQLREAVGKYDQATTIFKSVSDFANGSLATLNAGEVCFDLSEFREALKRYEAAAALAAKSHDRLLEGRALSNMGRVNSYMGNNDLAQKRLKKALDILKLLEKDSSPLTQSAYGEALANMGEVSYSTGNFAKALDQFNEAVRLLDRDPKVQARAHRFIGYITGGVGNTDKARAEVAQAQRLSATINDKSGEGLALTLLGVLDSFNKDHAKTAIDLHRKAIDIFVSIGDRHSEAIALNGLGQAYQTMNKLEVARKEYEEALRLLESVGAVDLVAVATFKLATIYSLEENHAQALEYYERCLTLSRAARKVRNEANALSEIAIVYAGQNRSDLARRQHRRAQEIYEKIGDRRGQAIALNNYGRFLLLKLGEKQQALGIFEQALSLSEQVKDPEIVTTALYNLALAHHALGNDDVALSFIERSLKLIEDLRADLGTADWRAVYLSRVRHHYELCTEILMALDRTRSGSGFGFRAFLMSEKSRARSLVDMVKESQAKSHEGATGELLRREREVSGLLHSMAEYELNLNSGAQKDSTEAKNVSDRTLELTEQYQEIEADLRAQKHTQSRFVDFALTDIGQIQRVLRASNAILLEYFLGEERSYLWAVTADAFQSYQLPPRKVLEKAAVDVYNLMTARQAFDPEFDSDYQARIDEADSQCREKARVLSQLLLGPVAEQLGKRTIVVVREGALQLIPFDTLPPPVSQTVDAPKLQASYLVETNNVVALPSISTLLAMRAAERSPSAPGKLVAVIADPVFNVNDDRVQTHRPAPIVHVADSSDSQQQDFVADPNLARLIHSSEEAEAILAFAPYGTTLVASGFDASRETMMSADIEEYQIVHFATHGFVDVNHPELSSIVLTMVDENGAPRDGVMPLGDIYNLDLSAQLTVLSACETALGDDVKGEGLVGLTHSFMSAGSKSVVSSLWKVDDRATAALMSYFYQFVLKEKVPPAAALRAAKLKMLKDKSRSAPYYWGGFVFQGDYETRIVVESSSHRSVGLVLAFVLVLVSGGLLLFFRRRRRSSLEIR